MPHKKTTTKRRKTASPAQKRQQARMKKAIAEAKKHQKSHPNKSWRACVKYGWTKV